MEGEFLGLIPNFTRIPFVDEYGGEYYLNLEYILPWGDLSEGGGAMGIPSGLAPMSMPWTKEAAQQISNYDWFWKEPITRETDLAGKSKIDAIATDVGKRVKHAVDTFAPTPVKDVEKIVSAARQEPDYRGRFRPNPIVLADVIAGFKMYPVHYGDRLVQELRKYDPKSGSLAQELKGKATTLRIKKAAMEKRGASTDKIDKQIEKINQQIIGLAKKMREIRDTKERMDEKPN
jgi:hypothetical protein